jgi:prepilin-type N-terminal cleavage/methylation domain-containing protein
MRQNRSRGATLIELLVTLTLLGIIASVTTLALRRMPKPSPDDPTAVIADTLGWVLASGRSVTLQFIVNRRPAEATVNPDGSVIADTALHIDRLTGRTLDAR